MELIVVICPHNPNPRCLQRALDALPKQTLPQAEWELLLIENASKGPLAGRLDAAWHPLARQLREERLGRAEARLRGISEARGPVLMFVDDDNVLAPDYLQKVSCITGENPTTGSWIGDDSTRLLPPS